MPAAFLSRLILTPALVGSLALAQSPPSDPQAKATTERLCATCHELSVVTIARYSRERWSAVVADMETRGMKATEAEMNLVIGYLAANYGRPGNSAAAAPAESGGAMPVATGAAPAVRSTTPPRQLVVKHGVKMVAGQTDWPVWGHDAGAMRYSPLAQITPGNVANLKLAWNYITQEEMAPSTVPVRGGRGGLPQGPGRGAFPQGPGRGGPGGVRMRSSQVTPLVIGNVMYLTTAYNRAVALEPETGRELWKYEVKDKGTPATRGMAYWPGDKQAPATLFFGTGSGHLVALNAKTGQPVPGFAREGFLDLRAGIADKFPNNSYGLSSPPSIYKDLIIVGSHVQEDPELGPPGDVRAFDVHSGKLVWTFHTVPRPGEPGSETWQGESWKDRSGANVWGVLTVDTERGMVFLPLGCVSYDYWGGDRPGPNLYGDSLVALDAATGKMKWYFQTTHHDIWDRDLEAPPLLMDVVRNGKKIPAVAQMTKQSFLFILDRLTGKPIYPVEERPVPQDTPAPGDQIWPTQPYPTKPPPLARTTFSPGEIAKVTPEQEKFCSELLTVEGGVRPGGVFVPFYEKATLMFPATLGGGNWHGGSFDPKLGYMFLNTSNLGEVFFSNMNEQLGRPGTRRRLFMNTEKPWPCQQPPWGELSAVDVNTGEIAWRVPLGSFKELEAKGIYHSGAPSLGGSIATAGGLVFVAGTADDRFRAFDSRTGKEVWVVDLPASAHTVPMTYLGRDGVQYVALMVSGGGFLRDHTVPATLEVFAIQ